MSTTGVVANLTETAVANLTEQFANLQISSSTLFSSDGFPIDLSIQHPNGSFIEPETFNRTEHLRQVRVRREGMFFYVGEQLRLAYEYCMFKLKVAQPHDNDLYTAVEGYKHEEIDAVLAEKFQRNSTHTLGRVQQMHLNNALKLACVINDSKTVLKLRAAGAKPDDEDIQVAVRNRNANIYISLIKAKREYMAVFKPEVHHQFGDKVFLSIIRKVTNKAMTNQAYRRHLISYALSRTDLPDFLPEAIKQLGGVTLEDLANLPPQKLWHNPDLAKLLLSQLKIDPKMHAANDFLRQNIFLLAIPYFAAHPAQESIFETLIPLIGLPSENWRVESLIDLSFLPSNLVTPPGVDPIGKSLLTFELNQIKANPRTVDQQFHNILIGAATKLNNRTFTEFAYACLNQTADEEDPLPDLEPTLPPQPAALGAGYATATLAALAFAGMCFCYCRRRRNRVQQLRNEVEMLVGDGNNQEAPADGAAVAVEPAANPAIAQPVAAGTDSPRGGGLIWGALRRSGEALRNTGQFVGFQVTYADGDGSRPATPRQQ